MAQSKRSPTPRRETHYTGQEKHCRQQTRRSSNLICTVPATISASPPSSVPLLTHSHPQNPFNTAPTLPKDQTRLNKVFTTLRTRYADRPGGYTRVLRVEPQKEDQAPSAILELVDGPKDMRLALTAKTIAHARFKAEQDGRDFKLNDMTAHNVRKVTRYSGMRGEQHLQDLVGKFEALLEQGDEGVEEIKKKRVYPDLQKSR